MGCASSWNALDEELRLAILRARVDASQKRQAGFVVPENVLHMSRGQSIRTGATLKAQSTGCWRVSR